jgi:hypothetical protein
MLRLALAIVLSLASPALAQTRPADAPVDYLDEGRFLFTPPEGWEFSHRSPDGLTVEYRLPDEKAAMMIALVPQDIAITPQMRNKMAKVVIDGIRANAEASGQEMLDGPKNKRDTRFYLKVSDVTRNAEGAVHRREHTYRVMGVYLVMMMCTAFTEDEAEAAAAHAAADRVLLSMKMGRKGRLPATGPATAPAVRLGGEIAIARGKLRVKPPRGWKSDIGDADRETIASWIDPSDGASVILLARRPLPKESLDDADLRAVATDALVRGEKAGVQIAGAKQVGDEEILPDERFLRKTRTIYEVEGQRLEVVLRQWAVGDAVISLTTSAKAEKAAAMLEVGDEVAMSVR